MSANGRLKALRLVGRVEQYKLETLGADMSRLRANQDEIIRQSENLARIASDEANKSTTDTRPYLPTYLASVDRHQQMLETKRNDYETQIADAQTKLFDAFRTVKTNEMVLTSLVKKTDMEGRRTEAVLLDDAIRNLSTLR